MRKSTSIVLALLLVCALSSTKCAVPHNQAGTWEKINDHYDFTYSWDNNTIKFSIGEADALNAYNRIKPQNQLSIPEKIDLFLIQPPQGKGMWPTTIINYPKMVQEAQAPLRGLSTALKDSSPGKDYHSLSAHALSFVQSIPYDRNFSNGTDYQTPVGVLLEMKGDCDSKSTLLAAILANWGIPWTILCSNNLKHAIIGIGISPTTRETSITQNGKTFVVAETSSTGWRLGRIAPTAREELNNGGFGVIRNKNDEKYEKEEYLTNKIEEAKKMAAVYNRQLIGQFAEGKVFSKWLDKPTIEQIRKEIASENLISFGVFPHPNSPYPTVLWSTEEPIPSN